MQVVCKVDVDSYQKTTDANKLIQVRSLNEFDDKADWTTKLE